VSGIDKYSQQKKDAGSEKLNQYANYYELQTLCEFMNTDFITVLNSDDGFCTKILLSNLERVKFETNFSEIMSKRNMPSR
jgi:hypothetical protein